MQRKGFMVTITDCDHCGGRLNGLDGWSDDSLGTTHIECIDCGKLTKTECTPFEYKNLIGKIWVFIERIFNKIILLWLGLSFGLIANLFDYFTGDKELLISALLSIIFSIIGIVIRVFLKIYKISRVQTKIEKKHNLQIQL